MSKDIKKALEHCVDWDCGNCPNRDELGSGETVCRGRLLPEVLGYVSDLEAKLSESKKQCQQCKHLNKKIELNIKNKLMSELAEKETRIAELEEQLKNSIRPRFRTYQSIFYITQFYTSTKGNPEYDIISDKYYVAENENEIILGWNYANDFNQRKYYYVRKDWVFANKEEAEAKLKELTAKNV